MVQEPDITIRRSPVRSWAAISAIGMGLGLVIKGIPNLGFLGHGLGFILTIAGFRLGASRNQCQQCKQVVYHFGSVRNCQRCGCRFSTDAECNPLSQIGSEVRSDSRRPTPDVRHRCVQQS